MSELELNVASRLDVYLSLYNNMQVDNQNNTVKVYDNLLEEYQTLRNGVGLRDISTNCILEFAGGESLDFLNRITTNLLRDLQPNNFRVTLFTNEKGRIIERGDVIRCNGSILLLSSAHCKNKLFSWVNKYIIMEDIKVVNATGNYNIYELIGPQAESFATLIFDNDVDKLSLNQVKSCNVDGNEYLVLKKKEFGLDKFVILHKSKPDGKFVKHLFEQKSVFDFRLIGEDAYEKFRIEMGIPIAPNELNDAYNPHEAGLINEVSFTKGCFIGQEVIARLDTYDKVQKSLTGVIINCQEIPLGSLVLLEAKNEIGKITSITYSPFLKKFIGLAYVRKEFKINGTILIAKADDGLEYPVTICDLPFKR
ncbi:MAG: hypothetical protein NTX22_02745 [Ignavibacteriales bacterium]|nr:hypothetical protein [Ignavibacteriales bacterium]